MAHRLTAEEIKEMRELVALGAYKDKVAEKFNISVKTVYYHIRDLVVKRRRIYQKIPEEVKEKIRERVSETLDREGAAEEFKLSYMTVCKITKGLPTKQGNEGIRGRSLKILEHIDKFGYFLPNPKVKFGTLNSYETLKKYFPNTIKRVVYKRHMIIYDVKRKIEACQAFMNIGRNRVCYWHEYRLIMSQFGICKPPKEAREMLGKMGFVEYPHPKRPRFKKLRTGGENPQNLDGFGNFLLSDVLMGADKKSG